MSELWEILVPRALNGGEEIPVSYHQAWDKRVREIAGGLTILKSARGIWESPTGEIFQEAMIPVRIACSEVQIRQIANLTMDYYDQEAVMAYRVSDLVIIQHKGS